VVLTGSSPGRSDFRDWRPGSTCCQDCGWNDSDCLHDWRRCGQERSRCQPQPAGRQPHGHNHIESELETKRLGLLHELGLQVKTIGVLLNPNHPAAASQLGDVQTAARQIGVELHVLRASTDSEIDKALNPSPNTAFLHSQYSAILSSTRDATSLRFWRRAAVYPRCTVFEIMPWQAA
jgi:hypothetical protein